MDPLAETSRRLSSYNYALNNLIRFIDVDGLYASMGDPRNPIPKPHLRTLPQVSTKGVKDEIEVPRAQTSRAARRHAMREAGIPTSQQPISQSRYASGRVYTYDTVENWYSSSAKTVQQQTMDISHPGQPHWEAGNIKVNQFGNQKIQMADHK